MYSLTPANFIISILKRSLAWRDKIDMAPWIESFVTTIYYICHQYLYHSNFITAALTSPPHSASVWLNLASENRSINTDRSCLILAAYMVDVDRFSSVATDACSRERSITLGICLDFRLRFLLPVLLDLILLGDLVTLGDCVLVRSSVIWVLFLLLRVKQRRLCLFGDGRDIFDLGFDFCDGLALCLIESIDSAPNLPFLSTIGPTFTQDLLKGGSTGTMSSLTRGLTVSSILGSWALFLNRIHFAWASARCAEASATPASHASTWVDRLLVTTDTAWNGNACKQKSLYALLTTLIRLGY